MATTQSYLLAHDHFRYFVRAERTGPVDAGLSEGVVESYIHPPHDGVIAWRLPFRVEGATGQEMGEIELTVTWAESEPQGVYDTTAVASACDIETPGGVVVVADYCDEPVTQHVFAGAKRCRVLVVVRDRDVSMWGPYRAPTTEHHQWTVWPVAEPRPVWNSGILDQRGQHWLDSYLRDGMDPSVGQREP